MNNEEGIKELKSLISKTLLPLIGKQCVLYDVPFYKNIGDVLIWQGELSFLSENHIEILDFADYHTYVKTDLSSDVTILFQGGGNIGDLYHEHVEMLLKLVRDFPKNRIIVFSQTVFYQNRDMLCHDFEMLRNHGNLFFCARDYNSYEIIKPFLKDKALVLPDMAFCIDNGFLRQWVKSESLDALYIRRNDIEAKPSTLANCFDTITDWPCFEHKIKASNLVNTLYDRLFRYFPFMRCILRDIWKTYAHNHFRLLMIKDGVSFISPFRKVASERLHGCILSILLGKKVIVVNNSYGKNKSFYEAWLKNFDDVELFQE